LARGGGYFLRLRKGRVNPCNITLTAMTTQTRRPSCAMSGNSQFASNARPRPRASLRPAGLILPTTFEDLCLGTGGRMTRAPLPFRQTARGRRMPTGGAHPRDKPVSGKASIKDHGKANCALYAIRDVRNVSEVTSSQWARNCSPNHVHISLFSLHGGLGRFLCTPSIVLRNSASKLGGTHLHGESISS